MKAMKLWMDGIGLIWLFSILLVATMAFPVTCPFMLLYTCYYEVVRLSVFELIEKIFMIPFKICMVLCIATIGLILGPFLLSIYFTLNYLYGIHKIWENGFVISRGLIIQKTILKDKYYIIKYIFPYNDKYLALVQKFIKYSEYLFDLKIPNDVTNLIFIFHGNNTNNNNDNNNNNNHYTLTHKINKDLYDNISINTCINILHQISDPKKYAVPLIYFKYNLSIIIYIIMIYIEDIICFTIEPFIQFCLSINSILSIMAQLILWPVVKYITLSSKITQVIAGNN